jgi:L-threonylcarbamoyladenylate synthase
MKVIPQKDVILADIVSALTEGKTIVYPTETCYGLGCDATNRAAVEKIFAIKGRKKGKPLLMIVHDVSAMSSYIEVTPALEDMAKKYWPGALTAIVPAKTGTDLAPGVIAEDGTVAFRVTSYPFAHALAEAFGKPIVSTSANIAGGPNPYTIEEAVHADIGIDAGELPRCMPSTIIRLREGGIDIVRQGSVMFS